MRSVEFISSMHSLDGGIWLAHNCDFTSYQEVLDAGGGSGGVAIGLTETLPHLRVTVAELPAAAKVAWHFVEKAGAQECVQVQDVDIVNQPITGSFDAAILRYVLQVLSPEENDRVLLNVYRALKPGGTIYIQGGILDESHLTPLHSVLWGLVFTAIYADGQSRTVQEYRDIVSKAGFEDFELDANWIITARKPTHTH